MGFSTVSVFSIAIFAVVFLAVAYGVYSSVRKLKSVPSFAEYRENNPEAFKEGKVQCNQCSGWDIFLKEVGRAGSSIINFHVCKSCGSTLYRSKV